MGVSYLDFRDWREATRTFESLAAFTSTTANVSDEGQLPEQFSGTYLSANAFQIMRQRPVLGRDFLPEDDRPGARRGRADRPRHVAEPLRQQPERDRPHHPHQRRARRW